MLIYTVCSTGFSTNSRTWPPCLQRLHFKYWQFLGLLNYSM